MMGGHPDAPVSSPAGASNITRGYIVCTARKHGSMQPETIVHALRRVSTILSTVLNAQYTHRVGPGIDLINDE